MTLVHATCIAFASAGQAPRAVLLRGPSGSGKSDLALRLIDRGWQLVADDQTLLSSDGERLIARAPETLAGHMEVRGVGLVAVSALDEAQVALVVDLVAGDQVERLPEPETCTLEGVELTSMRLNALEPSAPTKLEMAVGRDAASASANGGTERASGLGRQPEPGGRRIVLVSGLSGAGRTTAMDSLEDVGYEAIDNPPLELIGDILRKPGPQPVAIGVDIRTRAFAADPILRLLVELRNDPALAAYLLFIDCEDDVLVRRYSETRRRHPLAQERPLRDGIAAERRLIEPLRALADLVVDTTTLSPGDCRQIVAGHFGSEEAAGMTLFVTSFAFRNGLPRVADLVFDVRFLDNPHYEQHLRPLTGQDPRVAEYVTSDPHFTSFFNSLTEILRPLLPRYEKEGKSYLTIAVGCTGGRHRSVAVAERLADWLRREGREVTLAHRDLA